MRPALLRPALVGSLLLVSVAANGSTTPAPAQETHNVPADRHDDDGFDTGLLGLLGLAGLLGLKHRNDRDARHSNAERNDATRSTTPV
jgi:hypothetical protein